MNGTTLTAAALAVALAAPGLARADAPTTGETPVAAAPAETRSGYVEANGVNYFYRIYGKGEPLLLLHGGLGSIDMFAPILPILAAQRQVIGVDLQGHGRTALGERSISLIAMGDDVAAVLEELGYGQVDALGYSMGAGVAFRLAVQHPETVRRLALVSAGFAQDGFYPEMLPMQAQVDAAMADQMKETPMYKSYVAVAPKPEDFPRLLDRMGELMRTPFDWTDDVKTLTMPVARVRRDRNGGACDMTNLEEAGHRTLAGTCLCGAVEYAVADAFAYASNCHCSQCRRATGAAFKPFAGIERDKLRLTKGADNLLVFGDDGSHDARCKRCGSFLYSVVRDGAFVHVAMGTLVDDPTIRPTKHVFVGSKAPWFTITDDLPQYEEHVTAAGPIAR
ncbi:MAG: alpha/beta fold hydrolase [Dongiaceae bacterium]